MAKLNTINTAGMRTAASDIEELTNDYVQQVLALYSTGQELDILWSGDANATFKTQLGQDQPRFEALSSVVKQYIETLRCNADSYDRAEAEAIATLKAKTVRCTG